MNVTKFMYVIVLGCLCIYQRKTVQAQIFLKPFIGEMFTYKKHSIHRNSSAVVINMVTDINTGGNVVRGDQKLCKRSPYESVRT